MMNYGLHYLTHVLSALSTGKAMMKCKSGQNENKILLRGIIKYHCCNLFKFISTHQLQLLHSIIHLNK